MHFDDKIPSSAQFVKILNPYFSTQLCSSLLSGIESMELSVLQSDTFCTPSLVFDQGDCHLKEFHS
jgi:hypothetical protein